MGEPSSSWQNFNFRDDEGSAQGMQALRLLLAKLQEAQANPRLKPSVNNLLMTEDLMLTSTQRLPSSVAPMHLEGGEGVPVMHGPMQANVVPHPLQGPLQTDGAKKKQYHGQERHVGKIREEGDFHDDDDDEPPSRSRHKKRTNERRTKRSRRNSSGGSSSSSQSGRSSHGWFPKKDALVVDLQKVVMNVGISCCGMNDKELVKQEEMTRGEKWKEEQEVLDANKAALIDIENRQGLLVSRLDKEYLWTCEQNNNNNNPLISKGDNANHNEKVEIGKDDIGQMDKANPIGVSQVKSSPNCENEIILDICMVAIEEWDESNKEFAIVPYSSINKNSFSRMEEEEQTNGYLENRHNLLEKKIEEKIGYEISDDGGNRVDEDQMGQLGAEAKFSFKKLLQQQSRKPRGHCEKEKGAHLPDASSESLVTERRDSGKACRGGRRRKRDEGDSRGCHGLLPTSMKEERDWRGFDPD
ncbi:hypothetical protein L7F22_055183 [Adiantum nelumboides]|nr:hypothetical protein [Adiantum nelumboides]